MCIRDRSSGDSGRSDHEQTPMRPGMRALYRPRAASGTLRGRMDASRRSLLAAAALAPLARGPFARAMPPALPRISLAQWSFHRALRSGELAHLDFAARAKKEFGLEGVEYVNQFFADKGADFAYLAEMKRRASDAGVASLVIMVDGEGSLGAADLAERRTAIEKHFRWIAAAACLGCH